MGGLADGLAAHPSQPTCPPPYPPNSLSPHSSSQSCMYFNFNVEKGGVVEEQVVAHEGLHKNVEHGSVRVKLSLDIKD